MAVAGPVGGGVLQGGAPRGRVADVRAALAGDAALAPLAVELGATLNGKA